MIKAKKRFGQNFLKNQAICEKMAQAVMAQKPLHVLEIGPGQGALTTLLLEQLSVLTAIEIDRDLLDFLRKKFEGKNLNLIQSDVLEVDLFKLTQEKNIDLIFGNLPYNISTPLLIKYRDECPMIPGIFLLQKEVAERLAAKPGSKDYGRLSLMMQLNYDFEILFDVTPDNFHPVPKVMSSFIKTTPHHRYKAHPLFEDLVRESFCHRRKMIKKSLENYKIDFLKIGIDGTRRPETFSIDEFNLLASAVRHPNTLV